MSRKWAFVTGGIVLFFFIFSLRLDGQDQFQFYAVYDWIVDDDQLGQSINVAQLSGDGQKIFFANGGSTGRKAFVMNPNGSGLNSYNIPDGVNQIGSVAASYTGARAFFMANYDLAIYKLEAGSLTKIDLNIKNGPGQPVSPVRTTANGSSAYFIGFDGDLWKAAHDGSGLVKLIDDVTVQTDVGPGWSLTNFDVSTDGSVIAFLLYGYYKDGDKLQKNELFVYQSGSLRQLTQDGHAKTRLGISGDGSTIVYGDATNARYYALPAAGGAPKELAASSYNFSGLVLTQDGGKMFYSDNAANGGRMVNTSNAGKLDLFPNWNVNQIWIGILDNISIANDGSHMLFRFQYQTYPFKRALYLGHFNDKGAVPAATSINSVVFSPSAMVRGNPSARVKLLASLSDSSGLSDIKNAVVDQLINGAYESETRNLPAYFYFGPHDDGKAPDEVAGDGIYTTDGQPGGKINDYNEMTVRVAVKDGSKSVTVADVILPISNTANSITVTSPNGGENWPAGTTRNITWIQSGLTGSVSLELYKGGVLSKSIGTAAAAAGSYAWNIPASTSTGNDYKVRIYQGSIQDYSNANFSIAKAQVRKSHFIGTWSKLGVYYLDSDTYEWVLVTGAASMISAGDIDGDGIDDLMGVWPNAGGLWALLSSTGKWAQMGSAPSWLAVGNLHGDGRHDLIGIWASQAWIYDAAKASWSYATAGADKVTAADLDGDGNDDLIGVWPGDKVWVRYSSTNKWAELTSPADWITSGDMNGDGKREFMGIWGTDAWFFDSTASKWSKIASGATKIIAGDLDGDGIDDLIGVWPQSGTWAKYSSTNEWKMLSSVPDWMTTGRIKR